MATTTFNLIQNPKVGGVLENSGQLFHMFVEGKIKVVLYPLA